MTDKMVPPRIVALRFQPLGKLYHFDATEITDLRPGDHVLVSTSRGREMGEVVGFVDEPAPPAEGAWKKVERRATAAELVMRQQWQRRELEALIECRAQASEVGLRNLKIARAEYSYDGSRIAFLFVAEGDEKPDLKDLRKQLQRIHRQTQRSGAHLRRIHGLDHLHVCQRLSVPTRPSALLHRRHRLDYGTQLPDLRPVECRSNYADV